MSEIAALRAKMRERLPRASARWYDIRNEADASVAVVRIYSEIGYFGVTADDFAQDLAKISTPEIEVQINSPGGEVWDGIAIYNALRMHPAKVTTRVDGMAASIASVIAQAGDRRIMVAASQMVVHDAWGLCVGPAADMREFADLLDQQSEVIADIYAERSGRSAEEMRALMRDETWFKDQEAVDAGLADEIFTPERKSKNELVVPVRAEIDPALTEFLERVERVAALLPEIPAATGGEPSPTPGASTTPADADAEAFLRAVLAHTKETHE